jgi:hypothetical protein
MSIDLDKETLIRLPQAPEFLPRRGDGRPVHELTVRRWAKVGLKGIRLEVVRIGGAVFTSREALTRFIDRCSAAGAA